MIKFNINENQVGQRIDRIISANYRIPYGTLQKLFRKHKIVVNDGKKISPDYRCSFGDLVTIFVVVEQLKNPINNVNESVLNQRLNQFKDMIIFENDLCFIINKPAGIAVQGGSKIHFSIEDLINSYVEYDCKLVHRLDKDTSGILIIAKNLYAARELTSAFRLGKVKKKYVAILSGVPNSKKGRIENYIKKTLISNEEKMVVCDENDRNANLAITNFEIQRCNSRFCLINLYPETGRTHQLRVHCSEVLRAPILGDKKYAFQRINEKFMYLHASKVIIPDLKIKVEAKLPDYFLGKIESMVEIKNQAHLAYLSSL